MRVFLSADIEGVAGVANTSDTVPGGHGYDQACHWMTGEVTAAIQGAKEAGASSVIVADGHGGADNLILDALPSGTEVVRSWPRPLAMMQGIETDCDAAIFIGYHTGAHEADGVLAHTFRGLQIASVAINGQPASELTFNAMVAAEYGVPVVLVTGDEASCRHAHSRLEDVETVAVKSELGRYSARTLLPAEAQNRIREQTIKSLRKERPAPRNSSSALPIEITFKHHWNAELLSFLPFIERRGACGIAFTASSAREAAGIFQFITSYTPLPPEA
ncbi:MAG: M55 family metallopeptidase [Pseudomonadota bacterium]